MTHREAAETLADAVTALDAAAADPRSTMSARHRRRRQVIEAAVALQAAVALEAVDPGPTCWERIRWPDDALLPSPGHRIVGSALATGRAIQEVVSVQPDFEPGWINVEVRGVRA